ncbi:toprim domain-containing protein [Ruminococcus albus]|nr:toprim domain-containing protein [Ruminococcus albus]
MKITDEQKEKAAFVNLPQFLMAHGFDLKKVGREYVWKDHDSLHIKDNGPGERGAWFRFSEDKGGDNIGLLREYMDMSFLDAVEALTGEHIDRTYTPSRTYESKPVQQTARELSLAEADNCRRVFAYLCKTRGLDYDMLSALVKKGIISQEEKTGNVLFKYYDDQGKAIGAEKVGTSTEHKFKGIATGSAGGHGFEVVHGTGEKAFFFESAIDMLSYLQMHSKELDNCRLVSMMGVKPSIVLDTMLRHNIAPENVFLCSDNDTAGNEFARRLQEQYPDMKRIITPDTYKDWNDMLRNIPKQIEVEQETKTKEVDSVADLMTYGNKMWNNATDNRDKSLISMQLADFQRVQEMLEKSGINYYAYEMNSTVRMAVNDKDTDWLRKIFGNMNVTKSNRPYFPPEKNIIGNTEYRYIPQKEYVTADRDLVLKMADIMARRGMQFSGRIYPSGKGTLTVSHADFVAVRNIKDEVISMRKQFASPDKAQEVGNRDYCANRDTRYYMSKLTPEQFKEVKPFLETSVSYHAVSREGKVAFAVDKENAPAFHRALENAVREVGMLRNMADLGLTMEQNVALSPVVHRLAVEDVKLNLADFFDNRYDEAQFGEMLSLVDAYLSQAPAERYGEHSKLNDMLEAKSSFDRSIELSDFFSQHDFSDEQRAAITAMFIGDVTKGQIDSIDETFTAEDIQAYDEILHNALQESDVADFLTAHKQAVTDRENASKVPNEEEVLFQQADLAKFLAERTLSSDEWEDMAYPLFSSGYLDKHNPSDKATFGYNLSESALYDLAQRFHDGEDIRRELALGLLGGGTTADIEFIFEQGEISDRTYYYAENLRHALHTEKTEDGYHCSFSGMERFVSFEEIGQAFIDRIHEEFDDLAYWAVLDYIKDDIPDISDDTVKELITAFDGAALHGWENGDNQPKLNRIKKAMFDVLGDEEQTEKAFACIAKHKYNVTFESEQPEKQPDSLTFHFGKSDGDEWVSESDIVHDFALAHPDCSFALGNAVLEYLDEKQHSERNILELKAGWYKKTDFTITAVIGGEEFSYEGRFYIGDGKGTGGGSLIDHIRAHNEGILGYTQHPFNQPEYQERAKHTLDVFVPFLEAHSELTAEEQRIFDDFKAQHPIRSYDDITVAEEKLQTLQQVVDKFFGTDCESAETENGTWKLAIADGDKAGELFYGGEPVCGIYNRGDKMEIEPYRELSTFTKLLQTAMLEHDPDKPVEIMDFLRTFETPLDKAKWLINDFCEAEYREGADFDDLHNVGLAFTTLTDDELPIQVTADLVDFKITHEFDGEVFDTEQFDSIEDMIENGLTGLDFSDLVSVPDEVIDRHTGKNEQAVELISDASADIDKPLFTDETVIDEIQRNEQDDVPFWEKHDIEGEQLSLFGDPEPLTVSKPAPEKPKSEFAKGPVVDGVQVYEALAAEIDRGTGFVHGKLRVQDFYEEQHPTVQQLAGFLKKEYGTGGHSGEGKISLVDYNSQGITFSFENGEKFRHSWYNVATMTEARLKDDTYLSAEQKAERATLKAEQSAEERTSHDTVEVGDQFRHKITGEVSEVVSLTGALPFYTDDCTVSRESGGFVITENISYDKLLNSGMYEYIGRNDPEKEQPAHMKPEPVADVTPETEKPDIPDVKNLSQLKRAIKPGMMFEISDHLRPECVGERRIVTGVSTVDFTSRKLDENGEPTGKDIHVEFDRAKNWTFDGGELTSRLDNGDMLMSFHFIDGLERTKEPERETITAEVVSSDEPVAEESTTPAPTPDKGDNFTITDDNLGDGGAKMKFRANVDAIRTLKTLEAEKRPATAEEKEILSKYVGWGALAKAFDKNDEKWAAEYKELSELLTPQEYAQARSTVNDAFYTSPTVIDGIYEALGNFGFDGGAVLEPAMGIGNFFGRMPEAMQSHSQLYGVEIDSLSGRIAQALYPDADIAIQGFEQNRFQNGCFDVAIGNVPFGELSFRDTVHDTTKLHDYFFAEALSKLKDGGIMAFVTSAGTLDKRDETTRQMLADKADFIGAIRLPGGKNGAFKDNAGTEVTTDIIFLKKHEGKSLAEMSDIPDWVHIGETADGLPINKYFEQHPDMVLGTVVEGNKLYGSGTMVVAEDGFDLKSALHEAVGKLSTEISHEHGRDVYAKTADGVQVQIPSNLRNYSFFMSDDQVFFKKNNAACEFRFDRGTAQHKRFKAFIELRDLTRELIEAMELDKPDSVIKDLQTKLNVAYDDFYKKYGIIHSQTNKRYFSEDVSYNLVAGLEKSYDKTKLLAKSDIFTKRTIVPPKAVDHVDTALEALTLSVAEKARVDFSYMSGLTSMTEDELKRDLTGAIFKIPHTKNGYQTASEYLSGDIRKKLREAEEIAEYDPDFNINVSALKQAMPEPLKAGDIDIKLGAAWLDPKYYEQFMYELLQTPAYQRSDSPSARWNKSAIVGVEYSVHANSFHVSNKSSDRSVLATQKYGTHKMNAYDIFEHLLNLQEPKVYKTIEVPDGLGDTKEKRVVDIDATRVVQRKADDIRKAFKAWIFKDPQRREAIVEKYNELFNSIRPREFDGLALSFPMMTSDIKLHDHQKNAIAHAMFGGNTLFAHCVGAGKTFEMIATAMESKRLGLCTKSLFAVPNHLTEQIGDDFQKLYPGANILVATKKDFQKANRQQLFAKIATGNYDAVIIGHSQLGKIPISKERQVMTIQSQIDDILRGIEELKKSEGSKFQIKAMERTRKSLQKQLDKLEKANQDDTLTFEQLGIDRLFVDEAHEFKNLFVATKLQNVAGISNSASQKALDLFLKCRYLDEKTGGKGVVFATGTPLSNSITELHTMMRYLEYDFLNNHGLQHFDNWVAVFGDQKTDWELKPAGNGITDLYGLGIDFKKIAIRLLAVYCGFRDICPCIKQGHSFYP